VVRSCGDAGVWTLGYIKFMFDFKNYIIKIMSKYPSRHPVTLQGKLKLTKKKYLHILKFLLYFSIFPLYQLLADFSGWFRMKCKSLTTFDIMVHIQIVFLSSFSLGRGCSPAATPPNPKLGCACGYVLILFEYSDDDGWWLLLSQSWLYLNHTLASINESFSWEDTCRACPR